MTDVATRLLALIRRRGEELLAAALFLSRLPIRWRWPWPPDLSARAYGAFALIGAMLGVVAGGVYAGAVALGLPVTLAALVAVAALAIATGALHEDGLGDFADGIGGGKDREGRLAIMRDSRMGTYGGLALILAVGMRVGAIAELAAVSDVMTALVVSAAVSRALLPCVVVLLPPARTDGLAVGVGRPVRPVALVALLMAIAFAFLLLPAGEAAIALGGAALAAAATGLVAWRAIGGYTGDVLGATQQVADVAILLVLAARA